MKRIRDYLELPWSIDVEKREDDGTYYVARVGELPGLVATGETEEELDSALWEAVEDHVRSYLEDGEEPPLPDGSEAAFERAKSREQALEHVFRVQGDEEESASTVSTQEKEREGGVIRDRDSDQKVLAG